MIPSMEAEFTIMMEVTAQKELGNLTRLEDCI